MVVNFKKTGKEAVLEFLIHFRQFTSTSLPQIRKVAARTAAAMSRAHGCWANVVTERGFLEHR